MSIPSLVEDGLEARKFTATLCIYLLELAVLLPIALTLHYRLGEASAIYACAALAALTVVVGRSFVYLKTRKMHSGPTLQRPALGEVRDETESDTSSGLRPNGLSAERAIGVGLFSSERWSKPSLSRLIRDLKRYLRDDEMEAVLLILRYNVSPEDAATILGLASDEMMAIYGAALKRLHTRGKRLLKSWSECRTTT